MKNSEENILNDVKDPGEKAKRQGFEVASSSRDDLVRDNLSGLNDAIVSDAPITTDQLDNLSSTLSSLKVSIEGGELDLKGVEQVAGINVFLAEEEQEEVIYKSSQGINSVSIKPILQRPEEIKYKDKAEHLNESRCGEYTLNPESFNIDFGKAEVFVPDLSFMKNKKVWEVLQYVVDTYSDKYYIPGIEYWKWILENPKKAEEIFKKQGYNIKERPYFFPGSGICTNAGNWGVPNLYWLDSRRVVRPGYQRDARSFNWEWYDLGKIVLLKR